jgi:pyridoxamine 5'-phosphate oxidase
MTGVDPAEMRRTYDDRGLTEDELDPDPVAQFGRWFREAVEVGLPEPNAMVLTTVDPDGRPSARHVLLKGFGADGFRFFTNHGSRKARAVAAHPWATLVFPWFPMSRQVIVEGRVERLPDAPADAYWAGRPRASQLGAWASEQSAPVASRAELAAAWADVEDRFPEGEPVPRPPFWGGYLVVPDRVELWAGRVGRLHDRLRYSRTDDAASWTVTRLAP